MQTWTKLLSSTGGDTHGTTVIKWTSFPGFHRFSTAQKQPFFDPSDSSAATRMIPFAPDGSMANESIRGDTELLHSCVSSLSTAMDEVTYITYKIQNETCLEAIGKSEEVFRGLGHGLDSRMTSVGEAAWRLDRTPPTHGSRRTGSEPNGGFGVAAAGASPTSGVSLGS